MIVIADAAMKSLCSFGILTEQLVDCKSSLPSDTKILVLNVGSIFTSEKVQENHK
jgi:hypothetical protein